MVSNAHSSTIRRPLMAWVALLKAELNALSRSWVVRGWLIVLALSELFTLTAVLNAQRGVVPASGLVALTLSSFVLVWSTVVIVISAGSISLEAEIMSDSILCRACTRTQFIAAKLASRWLVVLGAYALFAGAAAVCAWRYGANDLTLSTLLLGMGVVALALTMLVSMGVAASVVMNNTVVAVISLLLLWYVAGPVFGFLGADYLSPASLARNLPAMLKDPDAPQVVQVDATNSSVTITFSKRMDPQKAEAIEAFTIESPPGVPATAQTAAYDDMRTCTVLSGLTLQAGAQVKVVVRGAADRAGNQVSPAADNATVTVQDSRPAPKGPAVAARPPAGAAAPSRPASGDRVPPRVTQCLATASSLRVVFSEAIEPVDAEKPANYIVESPLGVTQEARAVSWNAGARAALLSGLHIDLNATVKVTVRDVHDVAGNAIAPRGASATYTEMTNWKYVLGFGAPAILFTLLAVVFFGKRDL